MNRRGAFYVFKAGAVHSPLTHRGSGLGPPASVGLRGKTVEENQDGSEREVQSDERCVRVGRRSSRQRRRGQSLGCYPFPSEEPIDAGIGGTTASGLRNSAPEA